MYARWWLLLMMLPVWLLPSGASVPLCGCLFRPERSDGCCAAEPAGEDDAPSCCAAETGDDDAPPSHEPQAAPGDEGCRCTVTAPRRDDGPLPLDAPRLPHMLPATACAAMKTWRSEPRSLAADMPRIRGPAPGGACSLPLRL